MTLTGVEPEVGSRPIRPRRTKFAMGGGLVILLLVGCLAAARGVPPEWQGLTIHNDRGSAVLLFDCDDSSCHRGTNTVSIAAGRRTSMTENADQDIVIGMADPTTHRLLGCTTIRPSGDHDLSSTLVTLGTMPSCAAPVKVAFYTESG